MAAHCLKTEQEAVPPRISIIIPTLDEAGNIANCLRDLSHLRQEGIEIIVADGGSRDETVARASRFADRVITAPKGRALQLNAGAAVASGDILWFLHADTKAPARAAGQLLIAIESGHAWGRFDIRLSGGQPLLRLVERMMNLRSRLTGVATGDQGIFVTRHAFEQVGGYPNIALMEDIALSKRLRRFSHPCCLKMPRLITSSRRWEERGIIRTILLMWRLRLAYALGADPAGLVKRYYP